MKALHGVVLILVISVCHGGNRRKEAATEKDISDVIEKVAKSTLQLRETVVVDDDVSGDLNVDEYLTMFAAPTEQAQNIAAVANLQLKALKELQSLDELNHKQLKNNPRYLRVWKEKFLKYCSGLYQGPECNASDIYRRPDGSCNNLEHPLWGAAYSPEVREIPPMYDDGIDSPRLTARDGQPLPSARLVSNRVHRTTGKSPRNPSRTVMVMQWGQFIDHEFVATPVLKDADGSTIHCCRPESSDRVECLPIQIPEGDPYFSTSCMGFVRSAPAANEHCDPGFREQINQVTSFIDGSALYGSTADETASLRRFEGGKMLTLEEAATMLPRNEDHHCRRPVAGDYCQFAGDARVNVVPSLGLCHVQFLREHNRIAQALQEVNPHWDDETTFQEARRIVAAFLQHITYNEYLPSILNSDTLRQYKLTLANERYRKCYRPNVNPTIANEFAAAAFRFGHSQIPNYQAMMSRSYTFTNKSPIEDVYHTPHMITSDGGRGLSGVARWLIADPTPLADSLFESGTRNKLFLDAHNNSLDLPALNIQRGRDHGLPGYNFFRTHCKLEAATMSDDGSFNLPDHDEDQQVKLRSVYSHVNDIDLFAGAMTEQLLPNSSVGPTFACLIGRQFRRLKVGDRFWYETPKKGLRFTKGQLQEFRKISLARLLCNCFDITDIQPKVMLVPGLNNERVSCDQIPGIDFNKWKSCDMSMSATGGPEYNLRRCRKRRT